MKTLTIAIALLIALPAAAQPPAIEPPPRHLTRAESGDLTHVSDCLSGLLRSDPAVESFSAGQMPAPRIFTVLFRADSNQPRQARIIVQEIAEESPWARYEFEIVPHLVETGLTPIRRLRFRINLYCGLRSIQPLPALNSAGPAHGPILPTTERQ